MDYDKKLAVCKMRIAGKNIYEIAEEIDVLPQSIDVFIKGLPKPEAPLKRRPNMTDEEMTEICELFLHGETVERIAEIKNLTKDEICSVFAYLAARRPPKLESKYYPAVTAWMQNNMQSIRMFSAAIGYASPRVSDVLQGKRGIVMSLDMAVAISNYTGLDLCQIYAVQFQGDNERKQRSASPKKKREEE